MSIYNEAISDVVKSAPPLAVTSAMICGITVQDWAAILTGVYVLLQIYFLVRKQAKKEDRASKAVELDVDTK